MNKLVLHTVVIVFMAFIISISPTVSVAYYGWDVTDDPTPYYYQDAGKWYYTSDTKTFIVQLNDRTYKYVFELNGTFLGGYVTDMPIRLK